MRDRLERRGSEGWRPPEGFSVWEGRIPVGRGMIFPVGEGLGTRVLRRRSAMQITLPGVVWITAILVAAAPPPMVRAQGLGQPRFVVVPTVTNIRVQTTVTV